MKNLLKHISRLKLYSLRYIVFHLLFISSVASQDKPNLYFRNISEKDGLYSNNVTSIAEDKDGFMWFGGYKGLDRYDGSSFKHFKKGSPEIEMQEHLVNDIVIDDENNLFINQQNSVSITNLNNRKLKTKIHDLSFSKLTKGKSGILLNNINGLNLIESNQKIRQLKKPKIEIYINNVFYQNFHNIYEYKDGYIGVLAEEIYLLDKNMQLVRKAKAPIFTQIMSLLIINDDAYICSWKGCAYKLDLRNFEFIKQGKDNNKKYLSFYAKPWQFKGVNYIVYGCERYILLYDIKKDTFLEYSLNSNLHFSNIFIDSKNNLWISTLEMGVFLVNDFQATFETTILHDVKHSYFKKNSVDYVHALEYIDDKYFVCARYGDGIFIYDKHWNFIQHLGYNNAFENTIYKTDILDCYDIIKLNGEYICSSDFGLNILDTKNHTYDFIVKYEHDIKARNIIPLNDSIWMIRVNQGVYAYNFIKKRFTKKYNVTNSRGKRLLLTYMYKSKKDEILTSTENGLCYFNSVTDSFENLYIPSLNDILVYKITEDNFSNLWITTAQGLYKYNTINKKIIQIKEEEDELTSTDYAVFSRDNLLWFSTLYGVNMYNHKTDIIKRFDRTLGFFGKDDSYSVFKLNNNEILACGQNTIFRIDEEKFINFKENNIIHFTSIKENKTDYIYNILNNNIKFSPGIKNLFITFSAPSYLASNNILYSYKTNETKEWNLLENNQILLSSLANGSHSLYIKGLNKITGEETPIKNLTIEILPYFYQTWWFKLIILSSLVFLGFYLYKIRVRNITEKLKQRKKYEQLIAQTEMSALKAQMNPHFIFNCINSIDALIQTNDKYNATLYLNKFAKLIRNILESSKQNLVSFSKDMDTMKLYLELEELRNEGKFKIVFDVDPKLEESSYKVPPLIIQPYIENAIIHGLRNKVSKDGLLQISAKIENEMIVYEIMDNGIGRLAAKQFSQAKELSYGMQLSSDRIRLFNNDGKENIEIIDLYDGINPSGTLIKVKLNTQ